MDYSIDTNEPDSTQYPEFRRLLETMMNDQNALGWDQPARIYQVTGTVDDPALELLTEQMAHPIAILDAAYHQGMTLPDEALGMAISVESWAAVSYEEMIEASPHMVEGLSDKLREQGYEDEVIEQAARNGWDAFLNIIPFSELPDNLHKEVRTLMVVLRDGTTMLCSHTRNTSSVTFVVTNEEVGDVPEAVRLFLAGKHPVPTDNSDTETPIVYLPGVNNDYNPFA